MSDLARHPLTDLTVMITRPAGQADGLIRLVEEAGGEALRCPLLDIVPVEDPALATDVLKRQDEWDWLVFISANAVRFALDGGFVPRAGTACRIAAIGEATAAALAASGVRVDLIAPPPHDSESLLATPAFHQVEGQRLLIVRGVGGRERLADELSSRGAMVHHAELYRRVPVAAERITPCLQRLNEGVCSAVVITSGEALAHLTLVLGSWAAGVMVSTPLLVPGVRLAELARQAGWRRVIAADRAGDEAMVQVLKQLAHGIRTGQGPLAFKVPEPETPGLVSQPDEPVPAEPAPELTPDVEEAVAITETFEDAPLTEQETEINAVVEEPAAEAPVTPPHEPKTRSKSRGKAWKGYLMLLLVAGIAGGGWLGLKKLRGVVPAMSGLTSGRVETPEPDSSAKPVATPAPAPTPTPRPSSVVQPVRQGTDTIQQSEIAAINSQIASLQSRLATEESKVERVLDERGDQFTERLDSTRNELTGLVHQVQRQLNNTHGDLLIADAEYLLNIANQKLRLVGDVKSVLAAMEAADQRLHESGDPAVYKVREVLAEEMAALKKMNTPDVVGISARLIALEKKVPGLPLVLPNASDLKEHEKKRTETPPTAPVGQEGDAIDAALREIKGLVTVRRVDLPVEAVLAPEQVELLRQVLLLKLEAARVALLRNDGRLFTDSLTSAQAWLSEHFDLASEGGATIKTELAELLQSSLEADYPDISRSMMLLQNIEKLRLEAEDSAFKPRQKQTAEPAPSTAPAPAGTLAEPVRPAPPATEKPQPEPGKPADVLPANPISNPDGKPNESVTPKAVEPEKASGQRL